ncbi:Rhamnolipids biosynthesis 3-oxoacyl-[acyl-carrier-protein] reductase [Cladobotryum mycophilum]|uniref:Rhamnolipids biosynthesis 3-oxoacyl-[acyl-carrier-protein] reductase n=1 Tax=Cladobotryum mycophilum TaxID=491253 RepID=A0ABR0T533_9HYPO
MGQGDSEALKDIPLDFMKLLPPIPYHQEFTSTTSIVHGGYSRYNFVIGLNNKVILIDFEASKLAADKSDMEREMDSLEGALRDESGCSGRDKVALVTGKPLLSSILIPLHTSSYLFMPLHASSCPFMPPHASSSPSILNPCTGGGSGIGLMITQTLATNGAKVYITGRTQEKLDTVVSTYGNDIPGQIIALQGDISTKEGVRTLVDELSKREQCLCILVNNAGLSSASAETQAPSSSQPSNDAEAANKLRKNLFDADENSFEDWNKTYNTNVTASYFLTTALIPLLQRSSDRFPGWSSTVLNISSISGLVKSSQHHFAYNASKAAAVHLTRMLAAELSAGGVSGGTNRLKIRVNGIAPGVFPSEMTADGSDEQQKSQLEKEKYEDKVPAGRPGRDVDMAQAVLFAVANQYLLGQTIAVDGGYTIAAGQ